MNNSKGKLTICSRGHRFYKNSGAPVCPTCWPGYYNKTKLNKDVDTLIKESPKQTHAKLKQLRKIIKSLIPKAEEKISYQMPAYKYDGEWVIGFAGFKNHVSLFAMNGTFFAAYKELLKDYKTSKSAVQFPLDEPLPVGLIKKLIRARVKASNQTKP